MPNNRDNRVAWLINHATLHNFEVPLIRALGFEMFTPKVLSHTIGFRSAGVDYSQDSSLTIPADALECLNHHNFYDDEITPRVAEILNRYFGTVICTPYNFQPPQILRHYNGRILLRVFGFEERQTYSRVFREQVYGEGIWRRMEEIKHRLWFAACYRSIPLVEDPLFRERAVVLPLGLPDSIMCHRDQWQGTDPRILFVCPDIIEAPWYYGLIYKDFKRHFGSLPHLIAGRQSRPVRDKHVAGYASDAEYDQWFREMRVMFYHSREPRHLHYHPLEAVVYGMPLIYMKGGLLDDCAGPDQPGACDTLREARAKVDRILNGDRDLIDAIRAKQGKILDKFSWDYNLAEWKRVFLGQIMRTPIEEAPISIVTPPPATHRIAVMLPTPDKDAMFRAAKGLARMIKAGAAAARDDVDVVFSCVDGAYDPGTDLSDLNRDNIAIRPTRWTIRPLGDVVLQVRPTSDVAGLVTFRESVHVMPTDGSQNFMDCDLWFLVGDQLGRLVCPLRPYGMFLPDTPGRYLGYPGGYLGDQDWEDQAIATHIARDARFILTNNPASAADINCYIGLPRTRIHHAPLFFECGPNHGCARLWDEPYFLWYTDARPYREHHRIATALKSYYEEYGGGLKTVLVGPGTNLFATENQPAVDAALQNCDEPRRRLYVDAQVRHAARFRAMVESSAVLERNLLIGGELRDPAMAAAIAHARFVLHTNLFDTAGPIAADAASRGVSSLVPRYPAMEYYDRTFRLSATFYDPENTDDLARSLKSMDTRPPSSLPDPILRHAFDWRQRAGLLYDVLRPEILFRGGHAYR